MMRILVASVLLVLSLGCAGSATPDAAPPAATPAAPTGGPAAEAVIQKIYGTYFNGGKGVWLGDSQDVSSALGTAWAAASAAGAARGEDGGPLDFDPIIVGQDYKVESAKVSSVPDGDAVMVTAQFNNYDRPTEVKFRMVQEGGAWKIDNVTYENVPDIGSFDLRAHLESRK